MGEINLKMLLKWNFMNHLALKKIWKVWLLSDILNLQSRRIKLMKINVLKSLSTNFPLLH